VSDASEVANRLTRLLGLDVQGEAASEKVGNVYVFRMSELKAPNGFEVRLVLGWRSIEVELRPDTFAREVFEAMSAADIEKRATSAGFNRSMVSRGGIVSLAFDGLPVSATVPHAWPQRWRQVAWSVRKAPVAFATGGERDVVNEWSHAFLSAVVALLPVEAAGEEEGGLHRVEVNRYERSRLNRTACIAARGTRCYVCEMAFGEVYGALGEAYIEVHHVEPVSSLPPGTPIDPTSELVPVCANCHAMLHRTSPPVMPDVLRAGLRIRRCGAKEG
jgi:5-methylcytosine-specific restriction enzyme A